MSLRICLVTPHAWSVPHDTNEHVAGVADALRARGHAVVVLAPSSRSTELLAGRRALQTGELDGVVAISRAVPVSPRAAVGLPVGVRANVATALRRGDFDVVHGFDPALPGLSYVALLEARTTTAATFVDAERLGFPPRRNQRDRLLARIDQLLATSDDVAERAAARFPGAYTVVPAGVDLERFAPAPDKANLVVIETSAGGLPIVRAALRALRGLDGWEAILLRTAPLAARPSIPLGLRERVHARTAARGDARADDPPRRGDRRSLAGRARATPDRGGRGRMRGRRAARRRRAARARGAAALMRFAEDAEARRARCGRAARRARGRRASRTSRSELERVYLEARGRRREARRSTTEPLADREWIVADLHMHTRWSHDCSIEPAALVDHAESEGLGAIAVTDHNVFGGALETVEVARTAAS